MSQLDRISQQLVFLIFAAKNMATYIKDVIFHLLFILLQLFCFQLVYEAVLDSLTNSLILRVNGQQQVSQNYQNYLNSKEKYQQQQQLQQQQAKKQETNTEWCYTCMNARSNAE